MRLPRLWLDAVTLCVPASEETGESGAALAFGVILCELGDADV